MKKIGDVTSTADKNGEWTNGNVAAGIAPTILEAGWLNSVQREILGVLVEAGITQDKNNDNQLKDAIKKIISGGDYATKTEVNSKLAKDQNGADIQDKEKFIENLGLPEKFSPLSLYGKDSDGSAKIGSPSGAVLTFSYNGYLGTTNKDGVQVISFTNNGVLEKGSIPVGRLTGLTDSPGQSKTAVMSQYGVTQYAAEASVYTTASDKSAKIVTPSGRSFSVSYNAYVGVHDAAGNPLWLFDSEGKLTNGTIPVARVSGLQQIGVGQRWYSRTDRQQGTTYTNERNMPIAVAVYCLGSNLYVNEVSVAGSYYQARSTVFAIVPPGATYRCDRQSGVSENYLTWAEMY
ncbi:hypothetical protein [Morganella morganii]|uniref:hypothetical protein n=1 Tax=Morganella morganii TaxID=582 RepID=UPI003EB7D4AF